MSSRSSSRLKLAPEAALLNQAAAILIAASLAIVAGRIAVVRSVEGDTAFLSANDRSRWATVAALVEDGTYRIDRLIEIRDETGRRRPWSSIDRVEYTGPDGLMHAYSSKPPLLTTLVAGVYAVVKLPLGMTLTEQPIYMTRIVLALVNLPILFLFLFSVWKVVRDATISEFAKLVTVTFAALGTMLLPMSVSLNNHVPAAAATAAAMMIYLRREGRLTAPSRHAAFWAGVAAAFTAACELPALLMLALWTLLFWRQDRYSTLVAYVPGVIVVAAAFFGTNWIAHQTLIPPYAHRSDGPVIGRVRAPERTDVLPSIEAITEAIRRSGELHPRHADAELQVLDAHGADRWKVQTRDGQQRFVLQRGEVDNDGRRWLLRRWDNWYDYPGSYWTGERRGVDRGEPRYGVYAFHVLIGHHGIFSLTPFWLLMPYGLYLRFEERRMRSRWWLSLAVAAATLICLAFYLSRPLIDRNYGGVSCCFRWMLWFAPLWIWALLPAAHDLSFSRYGRWAMVLLFAAGTFSAATSLESPWQHPWLYRYLDFLGWLGG